MTNQTTTPFWLNISRQLHTLARAGLTFSKDPFDKERFEAVEEIAGKIMAQGSDTPLEKIHNFLNDDTEYYATPKLGVRAAVFRQNDKGNPEILMVREVKGDCWTIPGAL